MVRIRGSGLARPGPNPRLNPNPVAQTQTRARTRAEPLFRAQGCIDEIREALEELRAEAADLEDE